MNKDKEMPALSVKNDLYVEDIPPELQLTPLDNQCIARNVLFMKIKELPKTRMKGMVDRTVLVPIEPSEIMNTMEVLPRALDESAVVGVHFKRMKEMKNIHVKGFLRPTKLYQALVTLKVLGNPHYQTVIKKCLFCPREFKEDDKDMLFHVKQCVLKAQFEDSSNKKDAGIEMEELKILIKPRIFTSLEKMKSKLLEEIKPFTKGEDMSKVYEIPKVIDDNETEDEIEIVNFHFEKSKNSSSKKSVQQIIEVFGSIRSMEHWTKMQVMTPVFDKVYQLVRSKYTFEKVFQEGFEKTHYSVFTVNHQDVFNEAHEEAFDAVWDSAYHRAVDSVFDSSIYDSVQEESYNLALESCDPDGDKTKFDELFKSIEKPLLDKKIDSALVLELESAKNQPEFDKAFNKSVHSIFEETLMSSMESTYGKMIDSMYYEELEKTHQAYMSFLES